MADDKKITDLQEDTTPTSDDYLLTTDIITSSSKKVTIANLTTTAFGLKTTDNLTEGTTNKYVSDEISNLIEDTTPQLGGNLDMNNKSITRIETAGESLIAGDLCYLNTDGKYWKCDCTTDTTCNSKLLLANATIGADAIGEFIEFGQYVTTGLTVGAIYYGSETAGQYTLTAPTTSTSIVRIIGVAKSTTILEFNPDVTYIEVA